MRSKVRTLALLIVGLIVWFTTPILPEGEAVANTIKRERPRFRAVANQGIPERYIVRLEESVFPASTRASVLDVANDMQRSYGIRRVGVTFYRKFKGFVAVMPESVAVALSRDRRVRYVEQDQYGTFPSVEATQTNAPWHLDQLDHWYFWDVSYTYGNTGDGVNIYIVDTGVRTTHSEFGDRAEFFLDAGLDDCPQVWEEPGPPGLPGIITGDSNGHGTWVAALAAGSTYGVAKGANIISVRVSDTCSQPRSAVSWVVNAIENHIIPDIENRGVPAVVNLGISWPASEDTEGLDEMVENLIAEGVTVTIPAGNTLPSGTNASLVSPARVEDAIVVGAVDWWIRRAAFSNFGSVVDVFAPGKDVTSAWADDDNDTRTDSGTSGASPIVAGLAARFLEENPTATPAQVLDAILDGAALSVENEGSGSPRLFVLDGFIDGEDPPPTPPWLHFYCVDDPDSCLVQDQELEQNEYIESTSGQYRLVLQSDQNLVLYDTWDSWNPVFSSGTGGSGAVRAVMQGDGNFVLYTAGQSPVWATGTGGNDDSFLVLQGDGNLVVSSGLVKTLWETGSLAAPQPSPLRQLTALTQLVVPKELWGPRARPLKALYLGEPLGRRNSRTQLKIGAR